LNLRPSGYEVPAGGLQAAADRTKPAESLDSPTGDSAPRMQAASSLHKNFGQPVVRDAPVLEDSQDRPLTLAQAAKLFRVPEYVIRRACAEGHLEHLRVVNSLWLASAIMDEETAALVGYAGGSGEEAGESHGASLPRPRIVHAAVRANRGTGRC